MIKLQKRRELPQIQNYDCVVIGTPTYVGRAPKIVRDFSQTHLSSLLEKPLFLFIVGGEANVDLDTSLPLSFPKEFLSHLQSKKYLGGEFRFDKMNALSRFILRAVEKNK